MTLKNFIRSVGFILFAMIAASVVYLDVRLIWNAICNLRFATVIFGFGVLLILNTVAWLLASRCWKMFQDWNKATVADYADLQSLFTGIVVAEAVAVIWPHLFRFPIPVLGVVLFICMRGFIRRYLERYFGFEDSGPRQNEENSGGGDVVGTPWQSDPEYRMK